MRNHSSLYVISVYIILYNARGGGLHNSNNNNNNIIIIRKLLTSQRRRFNNSILVNELRVFVCVCTNINNNSIIIMTVPI